MRELPRSIEEVRRARGDLSSWLIHLTKDNTFRQNGENIFFEAKACLERILSTDAIVAVKPVGQFNHSWYPDVDKSDLKAVCFTETPIDEIFLFPAITGKSMKFSSYGLVFDKDELSLAPYYASPVMYFSQPNGDTKFVSILNNLAHRHYEDFKDVLYLFDRFGKTTKGTDYNFRWEREWRIKNSIQNVRSLVKFGLCPETEIAYFENLYPKIPFVDPFFNPRQIEHKLRRFNILAK